ncbi:hypothetical protein [Pedobacter sp. 22163]|uniref:hypothetical protein n=1 Tax=Pedobacter sp. 22163 TaxID=3453883 RepID=UPI003F827570
MTENEMSEGIWVKNKHFPKIPKMLVVRRLPNPGWWGCRYEAPGAILVYSEYHLNELELYVEKPDEPLGFFVSP